MTQHATAAAAYGRISDDREGLELGVTRQIDDARQLAARLGHQVPDELVFTDNDISASTRSRSVRPEFARLLGLIEAGRIGHVYSYSASRLTRRPAEFEQLIQLTERHGVTFHVVTGNIDLATADGRMMARMLAAADAAEAERIGERVARQKRQRAELGLPQGGRHATFGFTREWEVVEDQAARLREAFTRRAAGESITSIGKDIGVGHGTLVRVLANPTYCGLRRYKGEIVGELHPDFPRLIERDLWDAVQGIGEAPPAGTNARKYLLSGIARCGTCQGKMKGAPSSTRAARYRCASSYGGCGKVTIRTDWIDDPVILEVVSRELYQRGEPTDAAPDADAAAAVEAARSDIRQLQDAVKAGTISMGVALPMLGEAEARLREAERTQRQAAVSTADSAWRLLTDAEDLMALPLGQMRALIARHLTAVEIAEAPTRGRNALDLTRVTLHWTDGSSQQLTNLADGVEVA